MQCSLAFLTNLPRSWFEVRIVLRIDHPERVPLVRPVQVEVMILMLYRVDGRCRGSPCFGYGMVQQGLQAWNGVAPKAIRENLASVHTHRFRPVAQTISRCLYNASVTTRKRNKVEHDVYPARGIANLRKRLNEERHKRTQSILTTKS